MIEVVTGPMFSGKTEELMRRIRRAELAGLTVNVYKHALDDKRYGHDLVTHDGTKEAAMSMPHGRFSVRAGVDVVAVDEFQWFESEFVEQVREWSRLGIRVIVAGLDMDFMGLPFSETMCRVLAVADDVTKLKAVCVKCGADAGYSQRLGASEDKIEVGGREAYRALCHDCFFKGSERI